VANTFAERWIGSLRRELLDRTIIWNQHQLERLVVDYIEHYNTHLGPSLLAPRTPNTATSAHRRESTASTCHKIEPMRRPHQRVPNCSLTSHDRVSGTHTPKNTARVSMSMNTSR
jgi:hypothetical protein